MRFTPVPVSLGDLTAARTAKVRCRLASSGYDAVIVGSVENVLYAAGYESLPGTMNSSHAQCVILTEAEVYLVCPCADFAPAIDDGLNPNNVIAYGRFFFSGETPSNTMNIRHATFASALREMLRRISAKKVLVEWGAIPDSAKSIVSSWCDSIDDASKWMLLVRAQKLTLEQTLLKHVANLTELALDAGILAAAVGVTDKEVSNVVAATMSRSGGYPRNVTVAGGPRSALADVLSTERPLRAGDLLRFDIGCSYYGYKSDIARTAVVGEPTKLQQQRYDALLAGLETCFQETKIGAEGRHVFERAVATVENGGLVPYRRQHVGHAIGLSVYEWPVITPEAVDMFLADSTFCLETPYYEPGWGGMMVEDTGIVMETGFVSFTTMDRSLRVIPV